jgi:hypothetical protein
MKSGETRTAAYSILFIFLLSPTSTSFGQGTINFVNRGLRDSSHPTFYDAPVSLPDGTRVAGAGFTAGLFLVEGSSLRLVGTSTFRTGAAAGFFFAEEITFAGTFGPVTLRARVWETTAGSYENAVREGQYHGEFPTGDPQNNLYVQNLGGPPPFQQATMDGIQPFTLVPEPSTIVLGVIGTVILLFIPRPRDSAARR